MKANPWPTSHFGFMISLSLILHLLLFGAMMRTDEDDLSILRPQEKFGSNEGEAAFNLEIITEAGEPEQAAAPSEPTEDQPTADKEILKTETADKNVPTVAPDTKPSTNISTPAPPQTSESTSTSTTTNGTSSSPSTGGQQGSGEEKAIQIAEEMPLFPGCEDELTPIDREACTKRKMTEFIQKNVKYPDVAVKNNKQGKVLVSFVVEKDGSITSIKIIGTRLGDDCDEAAMEAVKGMNNLARKILAGKQNGKTVRVKYQIPVNFSLKERGKN
jgi:periplasmic protein TonB